MEMIFNKLIWGHYMDTKIEQVTFFSDKGEKKGWVDEFDIPTNEKHKVYYKTDNRDCETIYDGELLWLMIVDPQSIVGNPHATLPDIDICVAEERYSLYDFICKMVLESESEMSG